MKSILIAATLTLTTVLSAEEAKISRYIGEHGQPLAVATGIEKNPDTSLRTYTFFGLDQTPHSNLKREIERILIYSKGRRFSQHIGYHFEDIKDPSSHVGWTMFATFGFGTKLEIVQFDRDGNLIKKESIVLDVAYLEEGQKGNLIRLKPTDDKPNKTLQSTRTSRAD